MNTMNFNYQSNRACDEISSWRPVSTGKISHSSKLIRRIYYIFVNFDDRLKNIFRSKKNSYPKYKKFSLNSNHNSNWMLRFIENWIFILKWYEKLIIVPYPVTRETTCKNPPVRTKRSETGNSNLIVDTPVWFETPRGSLTRASRVHVERFKVMANTRFWERIRDIIQSFILSTVQKSLFPVAISFS